MEEIVYCLLYEVGYKFNFTSTPVELIPNFLGIKVDINKKLITGAELQKRGNNWIISVSPNQTTFFSGKVVFTERGRFSLTHEIIHFLMHYIAEKFPHIAKTYSLDLSPNESNRNERLCDNISAELLAPSYLFQDYSLKHVTGEKNYLLDIGAIEWFRKTLNISRFVLIQQLHHTKIIEESECGIIISFFNVNRNTGRSPALRVRYRALPRWGFIPENIKLSSIGLSSALCIFDDFEYGKTGKWKNKIKVHEKKITIKEEEKLEKWMPKVFESYGQHVAYSYGEQQRYVITTLNWPSPQKA